MTDTSGKELVTKTSTNIIEDNKNVWLIKEAIKEKWILFEAELIKELCNYKDENWNKVINTKTIAKTFADAMTKSVRTDINWDVYEDHDIRVKSAKELVKMMSWNIWRNGNVTVNVQNNTQNVWWKTIWKDDKLNY